MIPEMRQALVDALKDRVPWQVAPYGLSAPISPSLAIKLAKVSYDGEFGDQSGPLMFKIEAFTQGSLTEAAQRVLDDMLEQEGDKSVANILMGAMRDARRGGGKLGGVISTLTIHEGSGPEDVIVPSTGALGVLASWMVEVRP